MIADQHRHDPLEKLTARTTPAMLAAARFPAGERRTGYKINLVGVVTPDA